MKVCYKGGSAEIVEKKSRFIANISPVSSEEEAGIFIAEMKKKYWDCKHNCSAFVIAARDSKPELSRCSDDGEPSGTAGRPILDVILGSGVKDICIVVSRYFGGTLLGTGGLVRAYGSAAKEGLDASTVIDKETGKKISITINYELVGKIQYLASEAGLYEVDNNYADNVVLTYILPECIEEEFIKKINEATSAKAKLSLSDPITFAYIDDKPLVF